MPWKSFKLNDGRHIPGIGFGSAGHLEDDTPGVIDMAIEVGFGHIDTAQMYRNEAGVGAALAHTDTPRSHLWVTTKWSGYASIPQSIDESLEKLKLDYVDLYLIHNDRITGGDIEGTWKEMEKVYKDGKAKSIGVSNYTIDDLKRVLKIAKVKPVVNQILLHPTVYHSTKLLLEFMAEHDILAEGYSPLKPLRDGTAPGLVKVVERIAEEKGCKPEGVLMAWSKAQGVLPITTSSNKDRAAGYIAAGGIELSKEDVLRIDEAGKKAADVQERRGKMLAMGKGIGACVAVLYMGWRVLA